MLNFICVAKITIFFYFLNLCNISNLKNIVHSFTQIINLTGLEVRHVICNYNILLKMQK